MVERVDLPRLKELREERGVTLRILTEEAAVSYAEVWNAEYRHAPVRVETASRIAMALGLIIEHLSGDLPAPPPGPPRPEYLEVIDPPRRQLFHKREEAYELAAGRQ